jgi:flavin reductase (DIM6/NTAB) family NADH-FMN oxidoreductase RutF
MLETTELPPFSVGFDRAASHVPRGAALVVLDDNASAFSAAAFAVLSLDPALVSFTIPANSPERDRLHAGAPCAIAVLSEDQGALARRLSARGFHRLDTAEFAGALVRLSCLVESIVEACGQHIVITHVRDVALRGGRPLVSWRGASLGLHLDYPFLASESELNEFVRKWEAGVLPKPAWTHAAHVAVSAYYSFDHGPEELFGVMKQGITFFNSCVGTVNGPDSGYHETLTRFWAQKIGDLTRKTGPASRLAAAAEAIRIYGEDRDLIRLYYSFDVVRDRRARREWIPPDRQPPVEWLAA